MFVTDIYCKMDIINTNFAPVYNSAKDVPTICNHCNFMLISIMIYLQFWTASKYIYIACLCILLLCTINTYNT